MILRLLPLLLAAALCACAGSAGTKAHLSKTHDLVLVQASYAPVGSSRVGAPVRALVIIGTISNRSQKPLTCSTDSFLLTDRGGNAIEASTASCAVPEIMPNNAAAFNVMFRAPPRPPLQLRFEHDDGSYETRDLRVRKP